MESISCFTAKPLQGRHPELVEGLDPYRGTKRDFFILKKDGRAAS
jgi:hypothetical protein